MLKTSPHKNKNSDQPYEETHFIDASKKVWNYSLFTEEVINNFQQGTLYNAYHFFGNKQMSVLGTEGTYFAVWAPNATEVSVVGNFNDWKESEHMLFVRLDNSGVWEGFIPSCKRGEIYKYAIRGFEGKLIQKGDPYANYWEKKPLTASITWNFEYKWKDAKWIENREEHNSLSSPYSIYEVHLASWMRPDPFDEESYFSYWQIAERLVPYVKEMGFTHVEIMPVMEYPFDGSWGYQGTGYFAPTSRFGHPEEFMALVDEFHKAGIGVILDWVPSHFPYDSHGLFMFDGTHTYEYADMRKGYHPDWNSYIFNYKRGEVKSFLISNARFWFDCFHVDGLRVDAVSSMLKLDYSRNEGEWERNEFGGNGNLEAIAFLKDMNHMVYRDFEGVQFALPLSHDEVVHGKSPMIYKMPGDEWQKFANLRLLYTYMFTHPGAKLLFMGNEFAQTEEWNYKTALRWDLLQYDCHKGMKACVSGLANLLKDEPAMYERQFETDGFEWLDLNHRQESVISFKRKSTKTNQELIVILNMTPVERINWNIEAAIDQEWLEIFNSDDIAYWGTGNYMNDSVLVTEINKIEKSYRISSQMR